jgi:hypothetical protein
MNNGRRILASSLTLARIKSPDAVMAAVEVWADHWTLMVSSARASAQCLAKTSRPARISQPGIEGRLNSRSICAVMISPFKSV